LVAEEQGRDYEDAVFPQNTTDTEQTMMARETAQTLVTTIEALPFHQRVALIQRQFEGLDYDTIANNLDCSAESARAHVYQALRKLRLSLSVENPQAASPLRREAIRKPPPSGGHPQSTGPTRQSE
jgi:DNA-directed RNA polymerase specialized sigma24 family protein